MPDAGYLVKQARTTAGLRQSDLARLARVDQSHVSRIENGSREPKISELARLLGVLGLRLRIEVE